MNCLYVNPQSYTKNTIVIRDYINLTSENYVSIISDLTELDVPDCHYFMSTKGFNYVLEFYFNGEKGILSQNLVKIYALYSKYASELTKNVVKEEIQEATTLPVEEPVIEENPEVVELKDVLEEPIVDEPA